MIHVLDQIEKLATQAKIDIMKEIENLGGTIIVEQNSVSFGIPNDQMDKAQEIMENHTMVFADSVVNLIDIGLQQLPISRRLNIMQLPEGSARFNTLGTQTGRYSSEVHNQAARPQQVHHPAPMIQIEQAAAQSENNDV